LIVVAVLSAFIKNIGALAIMIPVASQFSRRSGKSPSPYLMPMSSAVPLGGLTTRIGTSPNIVVSRLREEITGALADLRGEDGNFLLAPICRPTASTTTRKYSGFARREGLVVHRQEKEFVVSVTKTIILHAGMFHMIEVDEQIIHPLFVTLGCRRVLL
jgi:hypothetical protein